MWSPADINSFPSPEETRNTKISIMQLESELTDATSLLEQTKRRIEELNADLERRRAWIAPIRRVPFELLSEIFVISSRASRLAPMTIAAVSHQWRAIVLATPRAWSFIITQTEESKLPPEYVSTYLERSKPCLLHLRIPRASCSGLGEWCFKSTTCDCDNVAFLLRNADRIGCLAVDYDWIEDLAEVSFPNLTFLNLMDMSEQEYNTLNMSRFPNLQSLILEADALLKYSFRFPGIQPLLLKHLRLYMDIADVWLDLVHYCASTLIALHFYGNAQEITSNKLLMNCPKLEHLVVIDQSPEEAPVGLKTVAVNAPRLTSYKYITKKRAIEVMHQHALNNLIELKVDHPISLAKHPHIRRLQTGNTATFLDALQQLELNVELCPYLHTIEVRESDSDDDPAFGKFDKDSAKRRLRERNQRAGSDIKFAFIPNRTVFGTEYDYRCGDDMPCQLVCHHL